MKMQFRSFATRLSIYTLTFVIVIFTVIIAVFYSYNRNKVTVQVMESTHGLLDNMVQRIGGNLTMVEHSLRQAEWMVKEKLDSPDSLYKVVASVVENNDLIVGSAIAFEPFYFKESEKYFMLQAFNDGERIVSQKLGGKKYDYFCMDWYLLPKLLKRSYWSEPYYDEGGSNMIMSTYSQPLYDEGGEMYAIFTANISLSQFTDMVDGLKPYDSSHSFLISRTGSYLTHYDREKIMTETIFSNAFGSKSPELEHIGREMVAGHTGTFDFLDEGEPSIAFYTSIPDIGWSVCNICRKDVILSELYSTSRNILYLFLVGVLLLFIFTYSVIKRLVRPLEDFCRVSQVIASGHFNEELPVVRSNDEMKKLRDSFAYMQRSLSEYVEELQLTTANKERIESELSIAREIQMGMIPKSFPPFPERKDVDIYAFLAPAKEVGGDLYDFFIEDGRLYFIIGDVSGKGIPASLFMAITRSLFRTLSSGELSPAAIVSRMNNSIAGNNESNIFVTLVIGILDLRCGLLKLCNAGHNPLLLVAPDGRASYMDLKPHLFAGIIENYVYVDEVMNLERGSKLFLYTDGVTEAENTSAELYGEERLLDALNKCGTQSACDMVNAVVHSVEEHVKGADPSDDLTIFIIHYKPEIKSSHHDNRERDPISE